MLRGYALAAVAALALAVGPAGAQEERKPPYWASISASKAALRTGPGRNYPMTWIYQRADLPIRVVETYPNWRKIEDPDGTTGWMLQRLLSDARTALVRGNAPQPMREKPAESARIRYLAEPGVVGRLAKCSANWCQLDVGGKQGYIRTDFLWGVTPGETIE
jgi:SH3-like domain-containing protein